VELSHISIVETEVMSQSRWLSGWWYQDGDDKMVGPKWRRLDGDTRTWVKPEVDASTVDDEMTRNRVRGSH
jgi:hypothetical protein